MEKIKYWLQKANGWKRLWFVLSVVGLLYMTTIQPFILTRDTTSYLAKQRLAADIELTRSECKPFSKNSLTDLKIPEYQDEFGFKGCYHLYNWRTFNNPTKVPYTSDDLKTDFQKEVWKIIIQYSAVSALIATIISALVYFIGMIAAWVVNGFRDKTP